MLRDWEREDPGRIDRIFDAMARVVPSHLMDRNLLPVRRAPTDRRGRRRRRPRVRRRRSAPRRRRRPERDDAARSGAVPAVEPRGESNDQTVAALLAAAALGRLRIAQQRRQPTSRASAAGRPAAAPATYAFERLPSQQAQPQQAQMLEDAARPRDRRRRLRRRRPKAASPTSRCRSARASPRPTARPSTTRSGTAAAASGTGRSATAATAGRTGARAGRLRYGWGTVLTTSADYEREVALLIRDKRSASRSTRRAPAARA